MDHLDARNLKPKHFSKGSPTLTDLARRLGADVRNPVAFDPQTGRFYGLDEAANNRVAIDEAHLNWLLEIGQRETGTLSPTDEPMVASFIWAHTSAAPRLSDLQEVARDAVVQVRKFMIDRTALQLPLAEARRVVEWSGQSTMPSIVTDSWKTAFWLRIADLLAEYAERIRQCERPDCRRMFLASDKRQVFCSRTCSQRTQFEKYVEKIGGEEKRREQQRQQYSRRQRTAKKGSQQ